MRLREPFSGYTLSSGHFIFHVVYLTGSFLPTYVFTEDDMEKQHSQEATLQTLRLAHLFVMLLNML